MGQIESNIETDTLPNGKEIANENLLCDARSSNWCSVVIYRGEAVGGGGDVQVGGDICIPMANSR